MDVRRSMFDVRSSSFKKLFNPQTMAVIGVSLTNETHPANVIYTKNHLRLPVKVFPVNPKGGKIGRSPVYRDISEVPEKVDLAVIAARAKFVPQILEQCIKSEVGGAVVISGGFAESGLADVQIQMAAMARQAQFPFIGPNCLGIYKPSIVDTFFLPSERLIRPESGNVGFISQSGGVLVDQMVKFAGEGIGISLAVSIGNKALVRETDLLEYLMQDPQTGVIAFYIEGFKENEGRQFVQLARNSTKPVIVLKAGKSAQGSQAVSSHTASLAGDYQVFSEVLAQYGIAEARNEFELLSFCESLSCYPNTIRGNVGIVTVSGGHGVLAVDALSAHGLSAPQLSPEIQDRIRQKLRPGVSPIASLRNPIDLTGSAIDADFIAAADALSQDPDIDCILMLLLPYSPGVTTDLGARLSHIYQRTEKPMIAYVPRMEKYRMLIEGFELNGVPVSSSIEGAVLMVEALRRCRLC